MSIDIFNELELHKQVEYINNQLVSGANLNEILGKIGIDINELTERFKEIDYIYSASNDLFVKKEYEETELQQNVQFPYKKIGKIVLIGLVSVLISILLIRGIVSRVSFLPEIFMYIVLFIGIIIIGFILIMAVMGINTAYKEYLSKKSLIPKKKFKELTKGEKVKASIKFILYGAIELCILVIISSLIFPNFNMETSKYEDIVLDYKTEYGFTIKESLDSFLGNSYKTKYFESDDGLDIVELEGKLYYLEQPADVGIQFQVNGEEVGDFTVHTVVINDEPVTQFMVDVIIEKIMTSPIDSQAKNEEPIYNMNGTAVNETKEYEEESVNIGYEEAVDIATKFAEKNNIEFYEITQLDIFDKYVFELECGGDSFYVEVTMYGEPSFGDAFEY